MHGDWGSVGEEDAETNIRFHNLILFLRAKLKTALCQPYHNAEISESAYLIAMSGSRAKRFGGVEQAVVSTAAIPITATPA